MSSRLLFKLFSFALFLSSLSSADSALSNRSLLRLVLLLMCFSPVTAALLLTSSLENLFHFHLLLIFLFLFVRQVSTPSLPRPELEVPPSFRFSTSSPLHSPFLSAIIARVKVLLRPSER